MRIPGVNDMDVLERFMRYARISTQSSEETESQPSTAKQFDLATVLEQELNEMGAADVRLTRNCYVYARIPSTLSEGVQERHKVGFIAHMDTAPSASDDHVTPRVVENYDGGDIELGHGKVLSPRHFPKLLEAVGCDLCVADGRTLLGADDKAGIAEIMAMAEYFLAHPEIPHGEIEIAFTPDEEIGRGTENFDIPGFGADAAYTVDGGTLGELEYENFNAAEGKVLIHGVNIHPGEAKDKMINAQLVAMEFNRLLPDCIPANTEKREGFFHLCHMAGDESECRMTYIIRDHDKEKFEEKKRLFREAADTLNRKLEQTDASVEVSLRDEYYNMIEKIRPHMELVDAAAEAYRDQGIEPVSVPIRGGTDGAMLSWKGLPCPNLSTGGENYHGIYEYLNVNSMRKMVDVLVSLARKLA